MRNAFATQAVATQAAHPQQIAIERYLNVVGANACQIQFHQPSITSAIHVGGRIPQTPGRTTMTQVARIAKEIVESSAGHKRRLEKKALIALGVCPIIDAEARNVSRDWSAAGSVASP